MGQEILERQSNTENPKSTEIERIDSEVDSFKNTHTVGSRDNEKVKGFENSSTWGNLKSKFEEPSSTSSR